jgi:hypothetical protein
MTLEERSGLVLVTRSMKLPGGPVWQDVIAAGAHWCRRRNFV